MATKLKTKAKKNLDTSVPALDLRAGAVFGFVAFMLSSQLGPYIAQLIFQATNLESTVFKSFADWQYVVSILICTLAPIPVLFLLKLKQPLVKGVLAGVAITAGIYCIFWRTIYIENDNLGLVEPLVVMVVLGAFSVALAGKILNRFKNPEYPLTITLVVLAFLFVAVPWAAININFNRQVNALVSSIDYHVYVPPQHSEFTKATYIGSPDDKYQESVVARPDATYRPDANGDAILPEYSGIVSMPKALTNLHASSDSACDIPGDVKERTGIIGLTGSKCTFLKKVGDKKMYVEYNAGNSYETGVYYPELIIVEENDTVYYTSISPHANRREMSQLSKWQTDLDKKIILMEELVPATKGQLTNMLKTGVKLYPVSYADFLDIPCGLPSSGGISNCLRANN